MILKFQINSTGQGFFCWFFVYTLSYTTSVSVSSSSLVAWTIACISLSRRDELSILYVSFSSSLLRFLQLWSRNFLELHVYISWKKTPPLHVSRFVFIWFNNYHLQNDTGEKTPFNMNIILHWKCQESLNDKLPNQEQWIEPKY